MRTLAIVAGLLFLVGCTKPHHVIQTPDGLVVSADLKKIQGILDSGAVQRHEVFRTITDNGAARAFRRQYGNQGTFVNWAVGSGLDQARPLAEDARRANAQQIPEGNRRADKAAEAARAEQERAAALRTREQQQGQAEKDAAALLAAIQDSLEKARWRQDKLDSFLEGAASLDERISSAELKARLHLVLGLFAWYADADEVGRAEFTKAKRFGATDCKSAVPHLWTPGSITAFNAVVHEPLAHPVP